MRRFLFSFSCGPSALSGSVGLALSIVLLLAFSSCSHRNRTAGYVYYRLNVSPSTLDPALITDVSGGSISAKLFNGLVRLDEKMNIVSDVAEKWTLSKDGLTYTFSLRQGVRFSNKREVTAADFKYTFTRVLDPKTRSPNTWVLEKIAGAKAFMAGKTPDLEGVRVKDGRTLEVRLEKPFSPFLYLLTMAPAYAVPEEEVRKWGPDFSSHPVGSGPFLLKEWLPNRELRLEAREDYFADRAKVRGIVYRIIPEDLTVLTEFELGNLDIVSIPASAIAKYRKDPKWKNYIESVKGVNTYYLGMNCSRPPFDNPDLRRAMNYAIDRKKLLATFYEGRGRLAEGPVPDLLRKWGTSYPYGYDPHRARKMIEQLGLTGKTIDFYVNADQEVVDMAELLQAYMKKAGLEVRIKQLEWSAFKQAINRGDADMFWLSWWADYPDPENFLFPLFHSSNLGPAGNRARYANPEVDKAIERGQAAGTEGERNRFYEQAERMIVHDAPWVFFWHKTDFTLRQPWIRNYRTYPIYSMDKGTGIELAAD